MSDEYIIKKPNLLIIVDLRNPESIPESLISSFDELYIILLGCYHVTDQLSSEQAREQFNEEATNNLQEIKNQLSRSNIEMDSTIVFTHEIADSIDRIVEEKHCDAILTVKPLETIKRILIPIHSQQQQSERIAAFVNSLISDKKIGISLINIIDPEPEQNNEQTFTDYKQVLMDAGVKADQIDVKKIETQKLYKTIVDETQPGDVVVIGESKPSLREKIFDKKHEKIIKNSSSPVILVLRKPEE